MKVPFYRHGLRGEHAQAIARVLESTYLTGGDANREIEDLLCQFFEVRFAALGNSWTNCAIAALLALNIGPGDEVIVPAQTFVATANVIELVGAKPVFVDVDPDTLLMTPEAVRAAMTPRVRAVICVHLYGMMCDVRGIRNVVGDEVALLEDSAHCFEGRLDNEPPGRHSDAAIFSFYATKNVTCGEGGAIITRREDLHIALRQAMSHGVSPGMRERSAGTNHMLWEMVRLGTKAALSDINAVLLGPQISNVHIANRQRAILAARYQEALADTPIRMIAIPPNVQHAHHIFPIFVPPCHRADILHLFRQNDIGVTVHYPSVPGQLYYRDKYGLKDRDFAISDEWGRGEISLPLFPNLTAEEQNYVISCILTQVVPLIRPTVFQ